MLMERIPAACAMEWSIELEKSLRSRRNNNKSFEIIRQIGSKLEWWSNESKLTAAEYDFFGLVSGEDVFYANSIVLRLVDAFCSGDKDVRICVSKVFTDLYRCWKRKRRNVVGVLSRKRFGNYLEVLRRVRVVFETGDGEVRALCLGLFGCLADFGHDRAEIRYLILSSLVSSDVLEVKASLFAAGCFCELSEDFACVVLEMLVTLISSSEMSVDVRIAGVRCLARLGRSYTLAIKAYEANLKLFSNSSEEGLSVPLMISLSKIAVKSRLLTSTQFKVLFSFLSQDRSFGLQATSLKCLRYILARGAHYDEASVDAIRTLSCRLSEPTIPPALQCDTLQILHKIIILNVYSFPYADMFELLSELLTIVENGIHSSTLSNRVLYVLVEIYSKFMETADSKVDEEELHHHLASRMISSVVYQIFLVKEDSEVKSLISLLFHLVHARTVLAGLMLEKVIDSVKLMSKGKTTLSCHGSELGETKKVKTKAMLYMCKVLISYLEKVDKIDVLTTKIHAIVKLLVDDGHRYNLFDCNSRIVLALLYMSYFTYHRFWNNIQETSNLNKPRTSDQRDFVQLGISTLNRSNELLTRKDNWLAYKAGKSAACHGTWFVAAFIFRKLTKLAQSHSCVSWLNLLADFAHSEMHIQFLTFPKQCSDLLNFLESRGISTSTLGSHSHIDNLVNACKILQSSEGMLNITSRSATDFSFQQWFLSLRACVMENVIDMFRLLDTISDIIENSQCSQTLNSLVHPLTQISLKFKRLAQELDLIAVSFIGMDYKSVLIISALALSCSLLAFSVGFVLYTPNIQAMNCLPHFGSAKCKDSLYPMLILDLLSRLWHVDREISSKLMLLLDACGLPRSSYIAQPKNQILDDCYETRSLVKLCGFAVGQAVGLQNDANRLPGNTILPQLAIDVLHLLLNITKEWMQIPFQTPSYLFRIRSPVSSQLFISNKDARHGDGLSVCRGSHLSLNLCLQLRNMPQDLSSRLPKLYCVLSTSASLQTPCPIRGETKQPELGFQDWRTDDIIEMHKKLFQYVIGHKSKITPHGSYDSGDCRNREVLVCFETNMKGQGFSTCLLDVSDFPVGSYRIKWHSCCIDSQGVYWSLLPSNPGPIFTVQDLVFNDAPWMENNTLSGKRFVHMSISHEHASTLGIQSVRSISLVSEEMTKDMPCMDFSKIHKLLGLYRSSDFLLFDLLELADCCKAKKLHIFIDKREHPCQSLLQHNLGEFQGSALVAILEGASLSREEIASLQFRPPWNLRGDTLNYGLGLLSCYSISDLPSVVSNGYFYMFDPRGLALTVPLGRGPAAKMFSLMGTNLVERFRDQFDPMLIGSNMPWASSESTIIRMPLSSEWMKDGHECGLKGLAVMYDKFMEHASRTLLFLKSVTQVSLSTWELGNSGPRQDYSIHVDLSYAGARNPFSEMKWKKFQLSSIFGTSNAAIKWHIIDVKLVQRGNKNCRPMADCAYPGFRSDEKYGP